MLSWLCLVGDAYRHLATNPPGTANRR